MTHLISYAVNFLHNSQLVRSNQVTDLSVREFQKCFPIYFIICCKDTMSKDTIHVQQIMDTAEVFL